MSHLKRIPSLDGLRAFSILLVCVGHAAGTVNSPSVLLPLSSLGNYGVKVFFVISGFLITYLLLLEQKKNNTINLKQFYLRRTFRIFPAFYFYIGCIALFSYFNVVELWRGDLLHAASYTMNYHHERSWWLNHTWSLAVEEQFYLLWPLALLCLGAVKGRTVAIMVVCASPIIRAFMLFVFDASDSAVTREFQAVADALAMGCLLAYLYKANVCLPKWLGSLWFYLIPPAMFVVPAVMVKVSPELFYIVGQTFVHLCSAAIIWRFITVRSGLAYKVLNLPVVMWVGGLSYSLYLWQEPFLNSWVQDWFASWPINLVLAFACALFSYYVIEMPCIKNRDKITHFFKGIFKFLRRNQKDRIV